MLDFFFFGIPCAPHLPHLIPHHSFSLSPFSWQAHSLLSFPFFFFFLSNTTHTPLPHSPTSTLLTTIPTIIFPTRLPENSLGTSKAPSSLLILIKTRNLLVGLYVFAWGYFNLSFDNDIHVIYELWKWYSWFYMYGYCLGGFIWWVGLFFLQWWLS